MYKNFFFVVVFIFLGTAVVGGIYYLFFPASIDTADVTAVYLETVDKNKHVKRIDVKDQKDVELFKKTISGKSVRDSGFVFAEGGYRIVLVKPDKNLELYPYCGGDLSTIRIGSKGHLFCGPKEGSEEYVSLEKLLEKYLDLKKHDGIWAWN